MIFFLKIKAEEYRCLCSIQLTFDLPCSLEVELLNDNVICQLCTDDRNQNPTYFYPKAIQLG